MCLCKHEICSTEARHTTTALASVSGGGSGQQEAATDCPHRLLGCGFGCVAQPFSSWKVLEPKFESAMKVSLLHSPHAAPFKDVKTSLPFGNGAHGGTLITPSPPPQAMTGQQYTEQNPKEGRTSITFSSTCEFGHGQAVHATAQHDQSPTATTTAQHNKEEYRSSYTGTQSCAVTQLGAVGPGAQPSHPD